MQKTALVLNSIVVVFFSIFLSYTFAAKQHVEGLARAFVTEKTLEYSGPIVEIADESLNMPIVKKLISETQMQAIRHEIAEYRKDAAGYIADLTRQKMQPLEHRDPNPLLEKVASIKERIGAFYDNTLTALLNDLRLFSASNLVAGLIGLSLVYFAPKRTRKSLVMFSFLLFFAVLYCSYLYIDDLTFFRILFRTHLGWWYPILLVLVGVKLYRDFGRVDRTDAAPDAVVAVTPDD